MTNEVRSLLDAFLALPGSEQLVLFEHLLESMSPEGDASNEDSLSEELSRRRADFAAGTADAISWTDLRGEA